MSDVHVLTGTCPGCGLVLPAGMGGTHPYLGASPACWARFGEVLAREYDSPALMAVHRLTVDAYAAQHPGVPGRRQTQSVWLHLAGLCCTVERGLAPSFAVRVIAAATRNADRLRWLAPPEHRGAVTVADIRADDHAPAVGRWARAVWSAWAPHHVSVRALVDEVSRPF